MKKLLLNIVLLCAAMSLAAQEAPEKLPMDPEVRYGKLDNGLTYYIRHNEQPKQRAEFHIAQAVGAILEEDHQNGLARYGTLHVVWVARYDGYNRSVRCLTCRNGRPDPSAVSPALLAP